MATTIGITNLPPGQASEQFPGAAFSTSALFGTGYVPTQWTYNGASTATQTTIPNAYTLVDNVQWTKGRHNFTFGLTMQWLQNNNAAQLGPSSIFVQTYNANSTANFKGNAIDSTTSGHPYASYMLGAVGGSPSITLQAVSETGGRYRTTSPYFQDDWKITPTLTVNLGVRWDYFPPYREAKDRMSFLNPGITNPATGNLGALQFAGDFGGAASCHCSTPVNTYWRNWGPRVGLAWQVDDKTVFRGGGAIVYSRAGGVGGRAGAGNGTGQLGFNVNAQAPAEITTGVTSGPSYYLNNGAYFNSIGLGNTAYGGPTYVLPSNPGPSTASQILSAGNYLNSSGSYVTPSTITFADPYISGRAPVFNFWNFGMERAITSNMTIGVNYVGSQSHFVVSSANNPRGYWTNQLNPAYLAAFIGVSDSTGTQSILRAPATPANIAKAQSVISSIALPYPAFGLAAGKNSNATIAQMLTAFPQYSGVSDIWGNNVANLSYNAFQLALQQRLWRGLTFNINYTFSKNLGDDGTFRSGFDIPASALSGSGQSWHMNRIERSWTTVSTPQSLHLFGVYQLPFGDQIGTNNWAVRNLAGGWQLSWIYTYSSGIPLAITFGGCTAPGLGQCMPDLNPDSPAYLKRNARINGSWGRAPGGNTAATLAKVQYIDVNAFKAPQTFGFGAAGTSNPINLIGNAPRTKPLNLSLPSTQELDMAVRRTFNLPKSMKIMIEADCLNVPNKVTFGNNSASGVNQSWSAGSTSFGTITAASSNSRDWQLAGHFIF